MIELENDLLRLAGALHGGILVASFLTPLVLDWKRELAPLPQLVRRMVWVHGAYVAGTILAIGLLSFFFAPELSERSELARALCGFAAVFWGVRLVLQFLAFDAGPWLLGRPLLRGGYHALTLLFAGFTLLYTRIALW